MQDVQGERASPLSAFPPRSPRPRPPRPRPTPTPVVPENPDEWNQHAHDAQRTGYTPQVVPYPWRLRWIWNGVDASGRVRKVTSTGSLPRNVQPVTGEGRVYIAAGVDGVFALREDNGQQVWRRGGIGDIRSTVAYDPDTQSVFALSADGRLYKLRASDGTVLAQFNTGKSSDLPLPPALLRDRVLFSIGNAVYAVNKQTMQQIWAYNAGSNVVVAVPPAYSASRDLVVVATEPDLYVHAIRNADGTLRWRVRPLHPSRRFEDPTEFRYGWPVIADSTGLVLVKVRLDDQVLYRDYPQTNSGIRQLFRENPGDQALFALRLD
ncbi:MAG: PQQ-binding-like beta-propeller repeat protein, partial [bacterium]|nr:PQQ-binding-like beta-propeller repeat protein [bacterium]